MKSQKNVIITCTVTGGIHTPTMSPHLPINPAEIYEWSVLAAGRHQIATPAEARKRLALNGPTRVTFDRDYHINQITH